MNKKLGLIASLLAFFLLLLSSIAWADTNGIWHRAEDIQGGIFGSDENYPNYIFPRNLSVNHTLDSQRMGIGTTTPRTDLEISGRWFVTSHGTPIVSGIGMFGSYNPSIGSGAGIIQVYDYDSSSSKLLLLQGSGGNIQMGTASDSSDLRVYGDLRFSGVLLEGEVPWARLSGYPSVNVGSGLEGGGSLNESIGISLSSNLEGFNTLGGTGIVVKTGSDSYETRSIEGTLGRIEILDGQGLTGNPRVDLVSTGASAGTYGSNIAVGVISVDTYGRITSASSANIRGASTTQTGVVQLRDSVTSTSTTEAATANSVRIAYNAAINAQNTANNANTNANSKVSKTGDTMSGSLGMGGNRITNVGTPSASGDAATKEYVDSVASGVGGSVDNKVSKTGDTMSGSLVMGGNRITNVGTPSASSDAATKGYVDTGVNSANTNANSKVSKTGDTMSGTLSMGGNRIINVGTPTATSHAATKGYVDTAVSGVGGGFTTCTTKSAELSSEDLHKHFTTVYCDSGWTMTGGGIHASWYDTYKESYSRPSGNGFYCAQRKYINRGNCYVRCCQ